MANVLVKVAKDAAAGPKKSLRFIKWATFTVLFAIGPLIANFLVARDAGQHHWLEIAGRGELFVIAAAITGDGLGRIWNPRATTEIYGTICFGALAFILLATCVEFGYVSRYLEETSSKEIQDSHFRDSVIVFTAAVSAALSAVALEDQEKEN